MTTVENALSNDRVLPISWDSNHTTAGEVRDKVKHLWEVFSDTRSYDQTTEAMWKRYTNYATLGKEEVKRQFEMRCFSTCGYKRAHDYSYRCWYCKFDLEYLIDKLNIDIEKETEDIKKNLNEVLEGYTH